MTVDELLGNHRSSASVEPAGEEAQAIGGAFGVVRAHRERALMVELRKKDGTILAVPYATIEQVLYTPGEGITVQAGALEVRIKGWRLCSDGRKLDLLSALASHRALWIQEQSRATALQSDAAAALIESIEW